MSGALPNLLVIGAQKAGTTLLHELLDAQPGVAMSKPKELDFFSSEQGSWRRGLDWYRRQFDSRAAVRGESSPSYTAHPFAAGVPERIASVLGEVLLVYVIRDPVDRLVSAVRHAIGTGEERRSPRQIFERTDLEGTAYLAMSRYAMQLERYRGVFGPDAVLVVDFDELIADPAPILARVIASAGGERPAAISPAREATNPAASWPMRRALRRVMPERAARQALASAPIRHLDHRLMRPAPPLEISREQRSRLESLLADDVRRLRELTGLPLPSWSV